MRVGRHARRALRDLRRVAKVGWHRPGTVHFLHVGKAAGTQIGSLIERMNVSGARIVKHHHGIGLADLPAGQPYFFSVRDPVARFRSGFYSRKRKGMPRYFVEWTAEEAWAFARFEYANDLAEALFADGQPGRDAAAAMRSIQHCSGNLVDWFGCRGAMFDTRPPIWIIRQERFEDDTAEFMRRAGIKAELDFSSDKAAAHANSYADAPDLSSDAVDNLRRWYVQDYEFLRLCDDWMVRSANTAPETAAVPARPLQAAEVAS